MNLLVKFDIYSLNLSIWRLGISSKFPMTVTTPLFSADDSTKPPVPTLAAGFDCEVVHRTMRLLLAWLTLSLVQGIEISYVIEPFETEEATLINESLNCTLTKDAAGGDASLRVERLGIETSGNLTWETDPSIDPAYNCMGATALSLYYKVLQADEANVTVRLTLLDDHSGTIEQVVSSVHRLAGSLDEWHEIRMDIEEFESLSLDHIRGWRLELSNVEIVLLDQLSCIGGGDMLGSAFRTTNSFQEELENGAWEDDHFESPLSRNLTETKLSDGMLTTSYLLEQTEAWGGFLSYGYIVPSHAYYNLSQANSIALNYTVNRAASPEGRAHLRIILKDGHDCHTDCRDDKNHEKYYSFYYVLDEETEGWVGRNLQGDDDSTSPFWLTGWSGDAHNRVLDKSMLKGFLLELNIDSKGNLTSTVTGSLSLTNLVASPEILRDEQYDEICVIEPDVLFDSEGFDIQEFVDIDKCCAKCAEDPECLFAFTEVENLVCYTANAVKNMSMPKNQHDLTAITTIWQDDALKRGDFCDVCKCHNETLTVDCSGRDLPIVPKTFSESWSPRVLNLSGNPRLKFIGSASFESLASTLKEIILPAQVAHLSLTSVLDLPLLSAVNFEDGDHQLQNVITSAEARFGDVCCSRGRHINGLTFCQLEVDQVGDDAVYLPFTDYVNKVPLATIVPSSEFMAEAAESPTKCAEYCSISSNCRFFSYDERYEEAVHTCFLIVDKGTDEEYNCCEPTDFADLNQTQPGWTSGYPARTRREVDNARVLLETSSLTAEKSNGYTVQYRVRLGSTPFRGAVWIEPVLATDTTIEPIVSHCGAALYDNETVVTFTIQIPDGDTVGSQTLVYSHAISACDSAFDVQDSSNYSVIITVKAPEDYTVLIATLVTAVGVILLSLGALYCVNERRKRQSDALWKVNLSELQFDDPKVVVGEGTFGVVLLAEYRGTQVAVKRVAPLNSLERRKLADGRSSLVNPDVDQLAIKETKDAQGADIEVGMGMSSTRAMASTMMSRHRKSSIQTGGRNFHAEFISEMRLLSKLRHPCITTVMGEC